MANKTATRRIHRLFQEARRIASDEPDRADHYVRRAWRIKLTVNASLTQKQRLQFCRSCHRFIPIRDSQTRLNDGVLTRTCPHCNAYKRIRYDLD